MSDTPEPAPPETPPESPPANLVLAQLIASRLAIQELLPEHNTLKLIEDEVFSLARKDWNMIIGKFEKPDMICEVKEDLKHISLTITYHEVNTPEAERQREESRKWNEQFEKRLDSYKEKHPEVKFPLKYGDPLPPEFPKIDLVTDDMSKTGIRQTESDLVSETGKEES